MFVSSFKYYVRECNNEIRNLTDTLNVLAPITPDFGGATSTEKVERGAFSLSSCNLSRPDVIVFHSLCLKVFIFPPQGVVG